jgi:hypothetical protein
MTLQPEILMYDPAGHGSQTLDDVAPATNAYTAKVVQ